MQKNKINILISPLITPFGEVRPYLRSPGRGFLWAFHCGLCGICGLCGTRGNVWQACGMLWLILGV